MGRASPAAGGGRADARAVRKGEPGRLRVRRFDADRRDREITLREALAARPGRRQLLWIDILEADDEDATALADRFAFDAQTRRALVDPDSRPHVAIHGSYVHVSVAVGSAAPAEQATSWLHVLWDTNIVITRRFGEVPLLDEVDDRIKADTTLGAIGAAEFVALLLDTVVTSYLAAVDDVEEEIDRLDERSLRADGRREVVEDLVRLRRRIAGLRRTLARQRAVFAALAAPDVRQIAGPDGAADLQAVAARFDAAVAAVEGARTALLGSFEVHMTRTAQRTNDVMKVLTIATVLLLPGSVIASLLGMNVIVPLDKDNPMSFWFVISGVAALALVVLVVARRRRWI